MDDLAAENSSNCTFMELKSQTAQEDAQSDEVLIVPLWN